MSEYLVTGRDPAGKTVTERVEAESADQAVRALRDRGFEGIVLPTDDGGSLSSRPGEVDPVVSPREFLGLGDRPGRVAGLLRVAMKPYRRTCIVYLLALALLAIRRFFGIPWTLLDILMVFFILLPALWVLGAQLFRGRPGGTST